MSCHISHKPALMVPSQEQLTALVRTILCKTKIFEKLIDFCRLIFVIYRSANKAVALLIWWCLLLFSFHLRQILLRSKCLELNSSYCHIMPSQVSKHIFDYCASYITELARSWSLNNYHKSCNYAISIILIYIVCLCSYSFVSYLTAHFFSH